MDPNCIIAGAGIVQALSTLALVFVTIVYVGKIEEGSKVTAKIVEEIRKSVIGIAEVVHVLNKTLLEVKTIGTDFALDGIERKYKKVTTMLENIVFNMIQHHPPDISWEEQVKLFKENAGLDEKDVIDSILPLSREGKVVQNEKDGWKANK